jgi:tetratricopeptide (TPR) repeat protein
VRFAALYLLAAAGSATAGASHERESNQPPPEIRAQLVPILAAADRFFEGKQYAEAQGALEEAVALWPAEPVAQFKLGMLLQQGHRPDLALLHLETAVANVPRRHPMHADILGATGRLELQTAKAEQNSPRRTTLMASGLEHVEAALKARPQLAKSDPMLPRLLAEAQSEVGGRRKAPKFNADWAEGHDWSEDPEFAMELEAVAGITAGEDSGTVERREVGLLDWTEFRDHYRGSGKASGDIGRPVLLMNATAGWTAHGPAWDKHQLLRRYGTAAHPLCLKRSLHLGEQQRAPSTNEDSLFLVPCAQVAWRHQSVGRLVRGSLV